MSTATEMQQVEKTILSTLKGVLTSEKVQIFLITHLLGAVVIVVAAKSGLPESIISQMLFILLGSSGIGSAVLVTAHANVDAAATTAAIAAAKANPAAEVTALAKQAVADAMAAVPVIATK
jgi:hypothetical protein